MKTCYKQLVTLIILLSFLSINSKGQDGAAIFKQNCTACHKLGQKLIGPNLLGVTDKRSEEWLISFIRSSQTMIKSGDADAVAIFEEFNQLQMIDQPLLTDDEIKSILAYIKQETPSQDAMAANDTSTVIVEIVPIVYTEEDVHAGLQLFSGRSSLENGGTSCISCHNINNNQLVPGGLLAKDLTNVYARMGDAGLTGILGAPPFPAMATSYKDNTLDSAEIVQLTAFLKHADSVSADQEIKSAANIFGFGGLGGLILLFLLIAVIWNKRLKASVKDDIYKRTIKGTDSII